MLRSYGAMEWSVVSAGEGMLETPTRVVRVVAGAELAVSPGENGTHVRYAGGNGVGEVARDKAARQERSGPRRRGKSSRSGR